jgi:hypothetical protein
VSRIDAAAVKARVYLPDLLPADYKRVKVGRDAIRAQCPIHGGEHLSLGMKDDGRGWWFNCWACGESGDCFKFVMLLDRCSFSDALRKLANDVAPLMAGPAPKRRKPALLLICDGHGCGTTRELEAEDRPYVGRTIATSWELRAGRWLCWRCAAGKTATKTPIEALGTRRAA